MKKKLSEKEIDRIVVLEADDESKWDEPIKVNINRRVEAKAKRKQSHSNISSKIIVRRSRVA